MNSVRFEGLAKEILLRDLTQLETAATIAYFARESDDWCITIGRACRYRGVDPGTSSFLAAAAIARKVISTNQKFKKLIETGSRD